jgi:threonine/homoserine/homoserine lactone efflux protein
MKVLHSIAIVCGFAAGLIIVMGFLALVLKFHFFGVRHAVNYFHVAGSLLLFAIFCLMVKKEKTN